FDPPATAARHGSGAEWGGGRAARSRHTHGRSARRPGWGGHPPRPGRPGHGLRRPADHLPVPGHVLERGAAPAPPCPGVPAARPAGPDGEVLLLARVVPHTVYVAQQISCPAEAMFSNEVRLLLLRAPEYVPPSPVGFWIQDLNDAPMVEPRVLNDRLYEVQ